MTAQEALGKIRVMLGLNEVEVSEDNTTTDASVETAETTDIKLASATLVDGTIVKTEGDFEVGKQLMVETAEGDIPAPEGSHETTDGLIVSVDADGVITSIDEVVVEEEETEQNFSDDFIGELVNVLKPSLDKINELSNDIKTLKGEFMEFKDEPGSAKVYNNLNDYTKRESDLMSGRMAKLVELRKNKSI
jgi:hypothetical protein